MSNHYPDETVSHALNIKHPHGAPRLIGLSGYARSGKDTTGEVISHLFGHEHASFAAALKEFALEIDPILDITNSDVTRLSRLSRVVDAHGWEEAKGDPEVRRLLQVIGTKVREYFGANVWVNKALQSLAPFPTSYVFTDVRFPNEADAINALGGRVFRVTRPGVEPINGHISEHAMDDYYFDGYIENDGTLLDLQAEVMSVMGVFV